MKYRLIIGILSSEVTKKRAAMVRKTWLSEPLPHDVRAFFLIGKAHCAPQIKGDILYLNCPDTYEHLPKKAYQFLKYAYENLDFDYIFKCDDDTYVRIDQLLQHDFKGEDYIGCTVAGDGHLSRNYHVQKVNDPQFRKPYKGEFLGPFASGGAGYILSKKAVEKIIHYPDKKRIENELYEDKVVGDIMRLSGIPQKHEPLLSELYLLKDNSRRAEMITYHPIDPDQMEILHQKINRPKGLDRYIKKLVLRMAGNYFQRIYRPIIGRSPMLMRMVKKLHNS